MVDSVVRMPRAVRLSNRDLDLVEAACRNVATRYRLAADIAQPFVRVSALQAAARLERIADRLSRSRETARMSGLEKVLE